MKYAVIMMLIVAMLILGCAPAQEEVMDEPAPYQPPVLREQAQVLEPEPEPEPSDDEVEKVEEVEEV